MQAAGDKIIVFSDNVFALVSFAEQMKAPYIFGATSHTERCRILDQFQRNPALNQAARRQRPLLLARGRVHGVKIVVPAAEVDGAARCVKRDAAVDAPAHGVKGAGGVFVGRAFGFHMLPWGAHGAVLADPGLRVRAICLDKLGWGARA